MKKYLALAVVLVLALPSFGAEDTAEADHEAIKEAISQGLTALKKMHAEFLDGEQKGGQRDADPARLKRDFLGHPVGVLALSGLALLECGLDANDEVIQDTSKYLRTACIDLTHTYSLSLCNMYFDRLGEARDVSLIESITVRLLAGQDPNGGWTYDCPAISKQEVRRLTTLVDKTVIKEPKKSAPKGKKPELSPEIKAQLTQIQRGQQANFWRFQSGDNSNTQFAILGLWVARRHGLPVDQALNRSDNRFRKSQNDDGGWGYWPAATRIAHESTPSMTCAGLIGLAVGQGTRVLRTDGSKANEGKTRDLNKDKIVRDGLLALGSALGEPVGKTRRGAVPKLGEVSTNFYFLWSLERTAMIYGLDTIGKKDWYAWGSELLLGNQFPDGSWRGQVNSSFALLFLTRANVARDLTASLKGMVSDPAKAVLQAGGVGGDGIVEREKKLKPAIDPNAKAPNPAPKQQELAEIPTTDAPPDSMPKKPQNPGNEPQEAEGETEADLLCAQLTNAPVEQRAELIKKFRDAKGAVYTETLVKAIDKLPGATKSICRDALAERMVRMTAKTLRSYLQDEELEMQLAAVKASAHKDDRSLVPDLIPLLDHAEPTLRTAAQQTLKKITSKDFGPANDSRAEERAKAIRAWTNWWEKQGEAR